MKKTVSMATLCASMALSLSSNAAEPAKKKERHPAQSSVKVGCYHADIKCATVPLHDSEMIDGGYDSKPITYCPDNTVVVQGNNVEFCVIPRPVAL